MPIMTVRGRRWLRIKGHLRFEQGTRMEWTTPQYEEVSLNCEINSHAKAELQVAEWSQPPFLVSTRGTGAIRTHC